MLPEPCFEALRLRDVDELVVTIAGLETSPSSERKTAPPPVSPLTHGPDGNKECVQKAGSEDGATGDRCPHGGNLTSDEPKGFGVRCRDPLSRERDRAAGGSVDERLPEGRSRRLRSEATPTPPRAARPRRNAHLPDTTGPLSQRGSEPKAPQRSGVVARGVPSYPGRRVLR